MRDDLMELLDEHIAKAEFSGHLAHEALCEFKDALIASRAEFTANLRAAWEQGKASQLKGPGAGVVGV